MYAVDTNTSESVLLTNSPRQFVLIPVSDDDIPPTVLITFPVNNAYVSGSVTVSASASDNVGVVGVQFKLNGASSGAEVTSGTYSVVLDSTKYANGLYSISATARDAAGNTKTASINVTISNTVAASFPDGSLVSHNGTIYVIEYGKKRGIVSMSVFNGLGYKLSNVTGADLSAVEPGSVLATAAQRHPRGTLIVASGSGIVYFVGKDLRYPFPSAEVFLSWGHRWKDIVPANSYDLKLPIGPLATKK